MDVFLLLFAATPGSDKTTTSQNPACTSHRDQATDIHTPKVLICALSELYLKWVFNDTAGCPPPTPTRLRAGRPPEVWDLSHWAASLGWEHSGDVYQRSSGLLGQTGAWRMHCLLDRLQTTTPGLGRLLPPHTHVCVLIGWIMLRCLTDTHTCAHTWVCFHFSPWLVFYELRLQAPNVSGANFTSH